MRSTRTPATVAAMTRWAATSTALFRRPLGPELGHDIAVGVVYLKPLTNMRKNRRQLFLVGDAADRQRRSRLPGPARPANSVNIGFDHFGKVEIDHHAKSGHIDAACRHIGGDQHPQAACLETAQHLLPDILPHVAMQRIRIDAPVGQPSRQLIGAQARSDENKRLFIPHLPKLTEQDITLVTILHKDGALADGIDSFARARGADDDRITEKGFGKGLHLVRHRGREKDSLACFRQRLENTPDRRQEAEIDHLITLVEHEMLDLPQINLALRLQILEPARRGDDDIDTLFQRANLEIIALAAADGQVTHLQTCRERLDAVRDLIGKFPCRNKHENACMARQLRLAPVEKNIQQRQKIGRRLAGAGLREANEVAPFENGRNRVPLDRCRIGQPLRRDIVDNRRCQTKLEERIGCERGVRNIAFIHRLIGIRRWRRCRLADAHDTPSRANPALSGQATRHPSTTEHEVIIAMLTENGGARRPPPSNSCFVKPAAPGRVTARRCALPTAT